jgi:hypothetical protein
VPGGGALTCRWFRCSQSAFLWPLNKAAKAFRTECALLLCVGGGDLRGGVALGREVLRHHTARREADERHVRSRRVTRRQAVDVHLHLTTVQRPKVKSVRNRGDGGP